jgi:hypothetical protein
VERLAAQPLGDRLQIHVPQGARHLMGLVMTWSSFASVNAIGAMS